MKAKINVVEILRDKPKGTKLYSSACGKCKLEEVYDKSFKISFYNSKFGFMNGGEGYLDKNGKLYDDGEYAAYVSLDNSLRKINYDNIHNVICKKDVWKIRLTTEEEKQKLFDALVKEDKAWNSEKII